MPSLIAPVVITLIAQATVESPVVILPPPSPPPIRIVSSPSVITEEPAARVETFRAEILSGREVLWTGEISASDRQPGLFTQSLRQSSAACAGRDSQRNELRLTLTLARERYNVPFDLNGVGVDVSWQRPLSDCAGQASLGFTRSVSVLPGATETVTGDAGLAVRLTRLVPTE